MEPVVVPSRQAAPLALITGELVRNAYRHGLADRPGRIEVAFGHRDGALELGVRDDGSGLGEPEPPRGFGLTLAALMAQQLRGGLELDPTGGGLRACVRFPEAT
jgi:two-component sensor histidine kinase